MYSSQMTPLTGTARELASSLAGSPLDPSEVALGPCHSHASAVEAQLASRSMREVVPIRLPSVALAHQPLEVELTCAGPVPDADTSACIARCLTDHACLRLNFETRERGLVSELVPVSARRTDGTGGCWIARALIRPASWQDAVFVNVASLSFLGRPLSCDCLPATLRVSYNHARTPAGAVFAAAKAGDVLALQAALNAGGSTEEEDEVREGRARRSGWTAWRGARRRPHASSPKPPSPRHFPRRTAGHPCSALPSTDASRRSACSSPWGLTRQPKPT